MLDSKSRWFSLSQIPSRPILRYQLIAKGALLLLLLILAGLWYWGPLSDWLKPEELAAWAQNLASSPLGGVATIIGFVLGSLVAMPVSAMIVATALAFGPFMGFVYALAGTLSAALVVYVIGRTVGGETLGNWREQYISSNRLSEYWSKHAILIVIFFRVVPVAPFTVVNLVAGASHIGVRDYLLGSLLGMAPGILITVLFIDRLIAALQEPGIISITVMILLGLCFLGIVAFGWRWLQQEKSRGSGKA